MKRVLVPTSGVSAAKHMSEFVMKFLKAIDGSLVALHVLNEQTSFDNSDASLKVLCDMAAASGIKHESFLRRGSVSDQIVDFAASNNIDIILMGASNGWVVDEWISAEIQEKSNVPVVILPCQVSAKV